MHSPFNEAQQIDADDALNLAAPIQLVFDDDPLEPLLSARAPVPPTPASVIELWLRGLDRSEACARAFVAVLVQKPDAIDQVAAFDRSEECLRNAIQSRSVKEGVPYVACLGALARLLELKNQTAEAEAFYRQALELLDKLPSAAEDLARTIGTRLLNLLEGTGRKEEAARLRHQLTARNLADKEDDWSLSNLRATALDMFLAGQYAEAEAIYLRLVEKRFELGSAHCHLARLYLMTDRESEARQQVARAWNVRHLSPTYVLARIRFLKILLAMLNGGEWQAILAAFNRALTKPGSKKSWTIDPVLEHLEQRLGKQHHQLLIDLALQINSQERSG